MRVGIVQMDSKADKEANLRKARELIEEAVGKGASLIGLPEYFNYMGPGHQEPAEAETVPGPTTQMLASLAKEHGIWLHGGSLLEKVPGRAKMYNTTVVFDPNGEIVTRYRKIHLFDIEIKDGPTFTESDSKESGDEIVYFRIGEVKVGLTICYDMRFPELYRILTLRGARIVMIPSAYTYFTGKDHWEPVLRTRAIENQIYIVASAQVGTKPGFQTYGHSLVIDPWGNIIAEAEDEETVLVADLDMDYLERIREQIPCLNNRRPLVYDWPLESG
jgi:predicted amidohydrolase